MSLYGAQWYLKDMAELDKAVQSGHTARLNCGIASSTWGNVHTILMANLISVVALTGVYFILAELHSSSQKVSD